MRRLFLRLGVANRADFIFVLKQFTKFGLVGISNVFLTLAIYYILVFASVNYIISYIVAFATSVLNAYYWNSKFVFNQCDTKKSMQLIKIYVAYGVTLLMSIYMMFLLVDVLAMSELTAPLFVLFITVPINFLLNKFWVFKR